MLLRRHTRTRCAPAPRPRTSAPAYLPHGYTRTLHPSPVAEADPHPQAPASGPPQSRIITTVHSAEGAPVHLHPAEYTAPDRTGQPTEHGYAWRCTQCTRITTGYPAQGFGRAHRDATAHTCEVHP